jgi:hypothetical protein
MMTRAAPRRVRVLQLVQGELGAVAATDLAQAQQLLVHDHRGAARVQEREAHAAQKLLAHRVRRGPAALLRGGRLLHLLLLVGGRQLLACWLLLLLLLRRRGGGSCCAGGRGGGVCTCVLVAAMPGGCGGRV